jgi:hypothetical protein
LSEREWRGLIAKQQGSGQGVSAFCEKHAVSVANFYRWRNLLAQEGGPGRSQSVADFVELGSVNLGKAAQAPDRHLELTLTLGRVFTLHLVRR